MSQYNIHNPEKYIICLDANNLYKFSMSPSLPCGGFTWVDPNIYVTTISDDSPVGYVLEVNLAYLNTFKMYTKTYNSVQNNPNLQVRYTKNSLLPFTIKRNISFTIRSLKWFKFSQN